MTDTTEAPGAVEAAGLTKRYRTRWALRDCSFRLPAGRICALVGPNGSGKSTLLALAADLAAADAGTVRLFGEPPSAPGTRRRVAYVAQDKPLYPRFTVAETLRLGRELNAGWDQASAERVVAEADVPLTARVGSLSGGRRTCVALALALGKRAELLLLDEPLSDQDPLRRNRMMSALMAEAAEHGTTVVISTHVLAETDGVCDYLLLLGEGRIRLAGETETLAASHHMVTGALRRDATPPQLDRYTVVEQRVTGRQFTALVRAEQAPAGDEWVVAKPTLEEILLGYLRSPQAPPQLTPSARVRVPDAGEVAA
ncbi:ATP-binding cassette domain-containing protein [Streptomyces sp. 3N207]|uniref:ATP-binding cassette domain-containing protein n=1 Tax=Streptomyces sp. 3N207 TaxID=3457417 RepID=UPI003FD4A4DE